MKIKKYFKIRTKITFFIIFILLILLPVLTFFNMRTQRKNLEEEGRVMSKIMRKELKEKGLALTHNIALSSETAIAGYDFDFLNMIIETTVTNDETAIYGFITDMNGKVFVHTDSKQVFLVLEGKHDKEVLKVDKISVFELSYNNDPVIEIAAPIFVGEQKWGILRIGFTTKILKNELVSSMNRLETKINRALKDNILLMLIFIIVGIAAAYVLGGRLASPIKKLTEGAKKISGGSLNERVIIKSSDEIGELAESFNYMAQTLETREAEIKRNYKELKNAYSKLDEYKEHLEDKVKERTEEVQSAYTKLRNLQEKILSTERLAVVGEMSGRIAHEILNPMTSISTKIELKFSGLEDDIKRIDQIMEVIDDWENEMKKGSLAEYLLSLADNSKTYAEEDIEILNIISGRIKTGFEKDKTLMKFLTVNLNRIVKIVDELRGMARQTSSIEEININIPIKETLEILNPGLEKRNIELLENFTSGLPLVQADINELIQVFTNIIKNGMQAFSETASKDNVKKMEISTSENKGRVEVRIKDNGLGIEKEKILLIFESGFTTKTKSEGTGLGLGISQRLIRKYKGDIIVEKSEPGIGTTFLIYLPVTIEN